MLALYAVLLLALIRAIASNTIWDPDTACNTMLPKNGVSSQSGTSPYKLTILAKDYRANDEIEVILSGKTTFTGFLIKAALALSSDDESEVTPIGELSSNNTNSLCEGTALTQKEATERKSISFIWKAPPYDVGPVVFRYSVVMNNITFWSDLTSPQLEFNNSIIQSNDNYTSEYYEYYDMQDSEDYADTKMMETIIQSDDSYNSEYSEYSEYYDMQDYEDYEDTKLMETTTSKGTQLGNSSGEKKSVASYLISSRWLFGVSVFACIFEIAI